MAVGETARLEQVLRVVEAGVVAVRVPVLGDPLVELLDQVRVRSRPAGVLVVREREDAAGEEEDDQEESPAGTLRRRPAFLGDGFGIGGLGRCFGWRCVHSRRP